MLSEYVKSLERRAKAIYSLWLSDRQFSQGFKSRPAVRYFSQIFMESKEPIQFKL